LTRLFKDSRNGQLPLLRSQLSGHERSVEWGSAIDQMFPIALEAKEIWDRLSEALFNLLPERTDASPGETGQFSLRLKSTQKPAKWEELQNEENQLYVTLGDLIRKGDKLMLELKEDQDDYQSDSLITDITGLFKDLSTLRENLRFFMRMDDAATVYWMEASGQFRSKSLQLYAVPVDVSAQLKEM
ncbi:ATP-dependent DNA helicase DinG, partial [Escherichia coli]|nr:ATP-dependent DNA helicase DinG [Escherichia coli]